MKFFLLIVFFSQISQAFTLTYSPNNKGYASPEIEILINQSSCPAGIELEKIVGDAIVTWNRVSTSKLKLSIGGTSSATSATFPPTAYCDSSMTGNTLGQGGSSMDSNDTLIGGLLRLNTNSGAAGYVLNQSYDRIVIVAAHELGHLIGLGHSDATFALMNYQIGSKTDLNLSQDDIDGVNYLYGRNELSGDQMLGGCGAIKTPPPSSKNFFYLLLLMALPLGVWRLLRGSHKPLGPLADS